MFSLKIKLLTLFLLCQTEENAGNVLPREKNRQDEFHLKRESLSFPGRDTMLLSSNFAMKGLMPPTLLHPPSPTFLYPNFPSFHLARSEAVSFKEESIIRSCVQSFKQGTNQYSVLRIQNISENMSKIIQIAWTIMLKQCSSTSHIYIYIYMIERIY